MDKLNRKISIQLNLRAVSIKLDTETKVLIVWKRGKILKRSERGNRE